MSKPGITKEEVDLICGVCQNSLESKDYEIVDSEIAIYPNSKYSELVEVLGTKTFHKNQKICKTCLKMFRKARIHNGMVSGIVNFYIHTHILCLIIQVPMHNVLRLMKCDPMRGYSRKKSWGGDGGMKSG